MPKRGKRGNLHLRQRGKKGTWYVYGYAADGKQFGKCLHTTSKVEANAKLKEIRARVTIDKAKKNLSWEEQEINTHGHLPEEAYTERMRELLETELGRKMQAEIEAEWAKKKRAEDRQAALEKKRLNPKVEDFWPVFLEQYEKQFQPNTIQNYRNAWKKLLTLTKPKRLGDINTALMRKFFSGCASQGMAPRTVQNYATVIQGVITKAIESGMFLGDRLQLPKDVARSTINVPERRVPTEEERNDLMEASQANEHVYLCVCLASFAGLRRGEVLNLEWDDVDFGNDIIHIRVKPSWEPKGGKARGIPLNGELKEILFPLRQDTGYVIDAGRPRGTVGYAVGREFRKTANALGFTWCRIHDLRHTFGSLLILDGVEVIYVQRWMGHSSSQITQDIYGHLIKDGHAQINKLKRRTSSTGD